MLLKYFAAYPVPNKLCLVQQVHLYIVKQYLERLFLFNCPLYKRTYSLICIHMPGCNILGIQQIVLHEGSQLTSQVT